MSLKSRTLQSAACAAALSVCAFGAQAQIVVRDAETGQLRAPTPAEAATITAASARARLSGTQFPTGAQKPVRLPSGEDVLATDASMVNYSVVRRQADGSLARECVTGPEAAALALKGERKSFAKNMLERADER